MRLTVTMAGQHDQINSSSMGAPMDEKLENFMIQTGRSQEFETIEGFSGDIWVTS
jgi:hypothetical protein